MTEQPPVPVLTEDRLKQLLSRRDLSTEEFLRQLVDSLEQPKVESADETGRQWSDQAVDRLSQYSVTLSHRVSHLLQHMLTQKLNQNLTEAFVTIDPVLDSPATMAYKYGRCFDAWVDASDHVSFSTGNKDLLGRLMARDVFILTLFAMATCRRTKGDNVLCLGVTGISTCGKSTLFENPLAQGAHNLTVEQGVGRFNVGQKNLLFLHDIDLKTLTGSKDTEKFKTISRTESTVAKVHSSTVCLPPLFLLYTSNQRLMSHTFPSSSAGKTHLLSNTYLSQANDPRGTRKEAISALQNRFLEAYCRRKPPLDVGCLPRSGTFQRVHFIVGLYSRILAILEHQKADDFYSPALYLYALMGLASNAELMKTVADQDYRDRLRGLAERYAISDRGPLFAQLMSFLPPAKDKQ